MSNPVGDAGADARERWDDGVAYVSSPSARKEAAKRTKRPKEGAPRERKEMGGGKGWVKQRAGRWGVTELTVSR